MSLPERHFEDINNSMPKLFSIIDDYFNVAKEGGRLDWVDQLGWPSKIEAKEIDRESYTSILSAISRIIKSAYEKTCYDLLRFLFDTLANAVRDEGSQWRVSFGKYGIIEECVNCIRTAEGHESRGKDVWTGDALRLLTNCCADPEEDGSADNNRVEVTAKLSASLVIDMITISKHVTEAVSLIYNLGLYEEDFRANSISARLPSVLWKLLEDLNQPGSHEMRLLGPVCEMLTWAPEDDAFRNHEAFKVLSGLSQHDLSPEDVEWLIDVALIALRKQGLPQEETRFLDLLKFLSSTCFVSQNQDNTLEPPKERFSGDDEEMLIKPRESFIVELSTLSGRPHTALHWSMTRPPLKLMLDWIEAPHFQLRICALNVLGNFAYQSESLSNLMIEKESLCDRLTALLKSETNGLVLKTALGAVQRFAKIVPHRAAFGQSGILAAIAPSWAQVTNLPLQQAALSTTRNLLYGSLVNVDRFMSEPALSHQSLLHLLLETFRRSEMSETRSDIAWTLERIWRSIYSDPGVRKMYDDKEPHSEVNEIAKALLQETIPHVHQSFPDILEPFLAILTSENQGQIVAATYTLTIIPNEERDYHAIYNLLCHGQGRAVLLAMIQNDTNPKAQMNCQALIQKLKSHYVDDDAHKADLTSLLGEAGGAT